MFARVVGLGLCFVMLNSMSVLAKRPMVDTPCSSFLVLAAQNIKKRRDEGTTTSFLNYVGVDKVSRTTFGVPYWIKTIKAGSRVFRRYVGQSSLPKVIQSSCLNTGYCAYVKQTGPYREEFPDLVGIFVTTRGYRSENVGLESGMPYVDFTLPPETVLFMLEPGIYLIARESLSAPILQKIHEADSKDLESLRTKLKAAQAKEKAINRKTFIPIKILKISR